MKKTYIAPNLKPIFLDSAESLMMLTGSDGLEGTGMGGNSSEVDLSGGGDSNRRGIWDNTEW